MKIYSFGPRDSAPRVVVTAGMDGDEYAGIEAAWQLVNRYTRDGAPDGIGLDIIPIVNTLGYCAGTSMNPLDRKYPKHIYPGNMVGSTNRMVRSVSRLVAGAYLWIDLHGGAITEVLTPFVWAVSTGVPRIDALTAALLDDVPSGYVVYDKNAWAKTDLLAKSGTALITVEAGDRGKIEDSDVRFHMDFVISSIKRLTTGDVTQTGDQSSWLTSVSETSAPYDGIWKRRVTAGDTVREGQEIGHFAHLDRSGETIFHALCNGRVLWVRDIPGASRGDVLVAIGTK